MAFSADELRVLRGALAIALQSSPASSAEVRETLRLAETLDEAVREGHRLRSFVLADLARYRAALPGAAAGYLEQLEDALTSGYLPRPDDLAALRTLRAEPAGPAETTRRAELLRRCEALAEQAVRARLVFLPAVRTPSLAEEPRREPGKPDRTEKPAKPAGPGKPEKSPAKPPGKPPESPEPSRRRPVPTPGEVFPPRRRPSRPPQDVLIA